MTTHDEFAENWSPARGASSMSNNDIHAFEIIVSVPGDIVRSIATARAVQHLNNRVFSHHQIGVVDIFDTNIYGEGPESDFGIGIVFASEMSDAQSDRMLRLPDEDDKVESAERVSYERFE